MKFLLSILLILTITTVYAAPEEDKVTSMPKDYLYDISKHNMYSGYLSLSHSETKKLHYVFVESQNDPANDPLVLWFNGGPGCSSLLGFADENGPTYFGENDTKIYLNEYSWNSIANVIYIEQPAGVGFSIAGTESDYYTSDVITGQDNLAAVVNFFEKFPEYAKHDFYISGESYAGIYVPYLANNIIDYNLSATTKINLKGILVGNGVTDWKLDTTAALMDFAYDHALYSYDLRQEYEFNCKKPDSSACIKSMTQIENSLDGLNIYDIYKKCYIADTFTDAEHQEQQKKYNYTPFLEMTRDVVRQGRQQQIMRFLEDKRLKENPPCVDGKGNVTFFNREDVKSALHVKTDIKYEQCNDTFQTTYNIDMEKGSYFIYPRLIENNLRVWKYSGDTDGAVPFNGTRQWIHNLGRPITNPWRLWRIDAEEVAGYVVDYDGISFVTVKGTGHMVPQWKRAEALHMFKTFLKGDSL